ncbi:DegT/DnrJ/EryC1/StrS family aminotransferase [Desulfovibrio aminophilus]|nr:DegT/DnrJ/EryC1/StrS family aminotransferase [Desulfovibrio aminophilus]MCM0753942.1 DegT/DnrJ/EryC1/StrS family aminotransferase [Desulfovibrio aminophilus]
MSIPFIDLKSQYRLIEDEVKKGIEAVLEHGAYVMGPEIRELEARLAEFTGTKHALACASGTDALLMALMALGIGRGDAVFTSPFTFMATAEVVSLLGATPVFCDIDPVTFNMDPASLDAAIQRTRAERLDLRPRAVISVDIFGVPCDYDAVEAVCRNHGLTLIQDAAQAFGALYKGKRCGAFGTIGCTSFFPAKPLGCYGDGGMCFTDSDEWDDLLQSVRIHGQGRDKYENVRLGINGRLDTMQAAVLLAKFKLFPREIELRQEVADRYAALLSQVPGLTVPTVPAECRSVWAQYSVLARDAAHRDELMAKLKAAGVPTAIYYPTPLHLQKAYSFLGHKRGDLPVCENVGDRVFSVPMHPYLTAEVQEQVAKAMLA